MSVPSHRPNQQQQRPKKSRQPARNNKPALMVDHATDDPAAWLGFSLPPRSDPRSALSQPVPRRSKRSANWYGSAMTREKFVNASFRFVLKPNESASYGAHFADPDIALHWPNILQILVPTFSTYSVAQGYVATGDNTDDDNGLDGEEATARRQRIEEEKQGRTCPICLSKPVAGRMTKCGHIFCLPCVLHLIQLSEVPHSASCPICGDTITENTLKSVRYLDAETMVKAAEGDDDGQPSGDAGSSTGSAAEREARLIDSAQASRSGPHNIHMRLLQRPQMTTLALPSTPTWPSDAIPPLTPPWHFLPDVLTYSRVMLATPEYMMTELRRELAELKREWDALAGDDLGRGFVKAAKEKVEGQMIKVEVELMTALVRRDERIAREAWGEAEGGWRREREKQRERDIRKREREEKERQQASKLSESEVPIEFLDSTNGAFAYSGPTVHVPANITVEPNPMPATATSKRNKRRPGGAVSAPPPNPPAQSYHFYQSSLGANVFLSPLDARILLSEFHSYQNFPPTITFTTTGYDTSTVTDELRNRLKYLSHLPVGSEVVFVDADLSNIVSPEVMAQFKEPLKARHMKRRDRTRRENRDKRRWEAAERAKNPVTESHFVPSALATSPGGGTDADLALALERSRLDVSGTSPDNPFPLPGNGTPRSASQNAAPTGVSPPGSFAWAVHSRTTTSQPSRDWGSEDIGVGNGFDLLVAEDEPEEPSTGRKKKGKKGKKIVLGGVGRQA